MALANQLREMAAVIVGLADAQGAGGDDLARDIAALVAALERGASDAEHVEELAVARRDAARTEERLRFILPNARIAVAEIDRDLRIQWLHDPTRVPEGVE